MTKFLRKTPAFLVSLRKKPALLVGILLWLLVVGIGAYVRFVAQPARFEQLQQADQTTRWTEAEMGRLATEADAAQVMLASAREQWSAAYKVVPDTLTTPGVVDRFNDLTNNGFEAFDVQLAGIQPSGSYRAMTYTITGKGYFPALYRFVWHIENDRYLYRIRDLQLEHIDLVTKDEKRGTETTKVMVSFSMVVEAYYGGTAGFGFPQGEHPSVADVAAPEHLLPDAHLATNPFVPVVKTFVPVENGFAAAAAAVEKQALPPNTFNHVEIEKARVVAIVGDQAIVEDARGSHTLRVGSPVYLGQITHIDPYRGLVMATLNKGGLVDEVERKIEVDSIPHRVKEDGRRKAIRLGR